MTNFCPAGLGAFSFGSSLGWSSPALEGLVRDETDSTTKMYLVAWIISLVPLGSAVGISVWTYFNNRYGPRKTMLIQSPFTLFAWMLLSTKHALSLYMVGRLFCGFFSVSYIISGETLLVESIHRANVPRMIIGHRSCVLGGVLFSYTFNGYMSDYNPDLQLATANPLFIIIHTVMLGFCPESPVFLYGKNEQKAIKAVIWYKGEENLSEEIRIIKKEVELKKIDPDADKYMFFSKAVVKALMIVIGLFFCQVFSGYYAFMFQYSRIWEDYGGGHSISKIADSFIYGLTMLTYNTLGSILHFRCGYGVRKPLILSCCIIFLANISSLIYAILYNVGSSLAHDMQQFFPLVCTCVYVVGYECGLSAFPDILLADYMPHQIYLAARMICKTLSWILVFIFVHIFTFVHIQFGMHYILSIMSITSFLTLIFVCVFVVETKNKTLIAIQIELGGNPVGNRGGTRQRALGVDRKLLTATV